MNERKVKTEICTMEQTFGNEPPASQGYPQRETRIKIHTGFQDSYISHQSKSFNAKEPPKATIPSLQVLACRRDKLKQQIQGQVKIVNIERSINLYLKALLKQTEDTQSGIYKQAKCPPTKIQEYLDKAMAYRQSVQKLGGFLNTKSQ